MTTRAIRHSDQPLGAATKDGNKPGKAEALADAQATLSLVDPLSKPLPSAAQAWLWNCAAPPRHA